MIGMRSVSVAALIVFCACLTLPAPGAEASGWQKVTGGRPQPLTGHAMAYSDAHDQVVLFGGQRGKSGIHYSRETWAWDGSAWQLRATGGPSRGAGHAMAYDSRRGRIVLFGGRNNYARSGETWEWDGNRWVLRSVAGPSPRHSHAMSYDSNRERVVMFGGSDESGFLGDTWEWNGSSWALRSSSGPDPRIDHAMAYDSARGRVVLFGGRSQEIHGDTWEWDGSAWVLRATSGPSPRGGHALAYDSARGITVLFGGTQHSRFNRETWEWDGQQWQWQVTSGPRPRQGHAMAYDGGRRRLVLFGGGRDRRHLFSDTWEYVTVHCTGQERIERVACRGHQGSNRLKVIASGTPGDIVTVTLSDGSQSAGKIKARGRGKVKFTDRAPGDSGRATTVWGCGAEDSEDYACDRMVNDGCSDAIELDIPSTRADSTRNATIDEGFPACGQGTEVIAPGVWYKVIGTGRMLKADTCADANFNTKLNIYENGCDNPICVVGNNNSCEDRSAVVWDSIEGVAYWILVHGTLNETGEFELSVSEAGDLNCDDIDTLRLQCDPDNSDLVATLETSLPEGWYLNLTLNDEITQPARVSNRGIAVAVFEDVAPGAQRVCVNECPDMCESADCP